MLQISRPKTEYKANDQGKEEKKVSCTSQFAANYALIYLSGARFLRCLLPFSCGCCCYRCCCWCLWGYCIRHCCCHFADAVPGDSALCICFSVCGAWACSCLIAALVLGKTRPLLPPGIWFKYNWEVSRWFLYFCFYLNLISTKNISSFFTFLCFYL